MSLRPMLFASNVEPLLMAAAARDVALVSPVVEWFRANLRDANAATSDLARSTATALLSGERVGQAENEDDVNVVGVMARVLGVQREEAMIADGEWKDAAWDEYWNQVRQWMGGREQDLFAALVRGARPLFGKEIRSSWPHYGYLHLPEVRVLRGSLERLEREHPNLASDAFIDGFHNQLMNWLAETEQQQTDLWQFAT